MHFLYALCSNLSEESKKLQQVYQLYRREKNEEGLFRQEGKQIVPINRSLSCCVQITKRSSFHDYGKTMIFFISSSNRLATGVNI